MKRSQGKYHEIYNSFYCSKQWQELRNRKWYDADGLCEMCKKKGIIREGIDVHHLVEISKDWSKRLDYDNLVLLCKDCHNEIHNRQSALQYFLNFWDDM